MKESFTGYVIEYHGLKVYFGGDTAYDQRLFVEAGARFPGLDLALLPIGPIEPRDFMRRTHMDPRESLQAFFDLGAKRMVPIHYETFINSTDDPGDALRELAAATKKWDLGKREVVPIAIGERRVFVKKGEGPSSAADHAKDPPPRPSPPPSAPTKPAAKPKDDIPDDDRLD
jgi:L-ascorbate metabolism protein UlaG (beta-lactamase superfamily)